MEAATDADGFIAGEVADHLGPDEVVEQCAYLVAMPGGGPTHAMRAVPYFLALTSRSLILIETRVGAFKPLLENRGVTVYPLGAVRAALVGRQIVIQLEDGTELTFANRPTKHVSSQLAFLERLAHDFGHGEAAAELGAAQSAFDQALAELTPRLVVTPLMVAVNVAVFVVMLVRGVHPMKPLIKDLLTWGANYGPLTTGGEPWRLLTCTFVHIGLIHIALNMWVLWDVGRLVERMVGNFGFAVLYLVTGVLASTASAWYNPLVVSAGASGAVFGVAGALLGIVLVDRGAIPKVRLAALRSSVGMFVLYNIVFGLTQKNIDQAAHLGGLAAGVLCGLVLARSASKEGHAGRLRRSLVVLVLGAAAIAGAFKLLPTDVADPQRALDEFVATEERVLGAFNAAVKRKADDAELATIIEEKMLPDWRKARGRLAELEGLPKDYQQRIDLLEDYARLRDDGWTLLVKAIRENDPARADQARAKQAEAEKIVEQLNTLNKK